MLPWKLWLAAVRFWAIEATTRPTLSQINGVFSVPGDGGIDFRPILQEIKSMGYEGWIVLEAEQDSDKANPYLYAGLGREYIKLVSGW